MPRSLEARFLDKLDGLKKLSKNEDAQIAVRYFDNIVTKTNEPLSLYEAEMNEAVATVHQKDKSSTTVYCWTEKGRREYGAPKHYQPEFFKPEKPVDTSPTAEHMAALK